MGRFVTSGLCCIIKSKNGTIVMTMANFIINIKMGRSVMNGPYFIINNKNRKVCNE